MLKARFAVCMSLVGTLSCALAGPVPAAEQAVTTDPDGTVHVSNLTVPISDFISEQAKVALRDRTGFAFSPLDLTAGDIHTVRESGEKFYKPVADRLRARYPVTIEPQTMGGVHTDVVTPKGGVSARNRERVLINVHGGGFFLGAGSGALVETIPIAGLGKFKVVTVDYRMAPEYQFPAASEDVAAVYKTLLRQYKPENIGIYGCSAGGALTAQAVPWLQKAGLPRPGAIGIFGSGAARNMRGDSSYIAPPIAHFPNLGHVPYMTYMSKADPNDPLVSPASSLAVLAKFPPTLLINATRDPSVSTALYTHSQLVKAGVEADLHVWEGLWHCFLFDDIPEARDAYDVTVKFFDKHLGVNKRE